MKNKKTIIYIFIFIIFFAVVLILVKSGQSLSENKSSERLSDLESDDSPLSAVLVFNTDKSVSAIGEPIIVYVSAVDKDGNTLCDCDLEIDIIGPENNKIILTTESGDITKSTACLEDGGKTNDPDYQSYFVPDKEGAYKIEVLDINSKLKSEKEIVIKNENNINVARYSTARVNPSEKDRYHMILKVTSKENFSGKVVDLTPSSLNIVWKGEASIETDVGSDQTKISWDVDLRAGETQELIYDYQVLESGAQIYSLGRLVVLEEDSNTVVFEEVNFWDLVEGKKLQGAK